MRFKFILLFNLLFYKVVIIRAEILAYPTQGGGNKEGVFQSEFLAFVSKPTAIYGATLIMAEPRDACRPLVPPAPTLHSDTSFVLLATEDGCDLFTKILFAQEANYQSIIIITKSSKHPIILEDNDEEKGPFKINPSFVGAAAGKKLEGFVYNPTSNARFLVDISFKKKKKVAKKPKPQYQEKKQQQSDSVKTTDYHYTNPDDFKLNFPKLVYLIVLIISVFALTVIYQGVSTFIGRAEREEQERRQEQQRQEQERQEQQRKEQERQGQQRQEQQRQEQQRQEQERQRREEAQRNQRQQNNGRVFIPPTRLESLRLLGFGFLETPNKDQVESAFRRKSRNAHPDKFPEHLREQKQQEFVRLAAAKDKLL